MLNEKLFLSFDVAKVSSFSRSRKFIQRTARFLERTVDDKRIARQVLPNVKFVLCTPFYTPARDYHAVLVPFDSMFKELQKNQPTPKYWI